MQANALRRQDRTGGVEDVDQVSYAPDAALVQLMSGASMDVAGLGIKEGLIDHSQGIGIANGILNSRRDSAQRVIDSIGNS